MEMNYLAGQTGFLNAILQHVERTHDWRMRQTEMPWSMRAAVYFCGEKVRVAYTMRPASPMSKNWIPGTFQKVPIFRPADAPIEDIKYLEDRNER